MPGRSTCPHPFRSRRGPALLKRTMAASGSLKEETVDQNAGGAQSGKTGKRERQGTLSFLPIFTILPCRTSKGCESPWIHDPPQTAEPLPFGGSFPSSFRQPAGAPAGKLGLCSRLGRSTIRTPLPGGWALGGAIGPISGGPGLTGQAPERQVGGITDGWQNRSHEGAPHRPSGASRLEACRDVQCGRRRRS